MLVLEKEGASRGFHRSVVLTVKASRHLMASSRATLQVTDSEVRGGVSFHALVSPLGTPLALTREPLNEEACEEACSYNRTAR